MIKKKKLSLVAWIENIRLKLLTKNDHIYFIRDNGGRGSISYWLVTLPKDWIYWRDGRHDKTKLTGQQVKKTRVRWPDLFSTYVFLDDSPIPFKQ